MSDTCLKFQSVSSPARQSDLDLSDLEVKVINLNFLDRVSLMFRGEVCFRQLMLSYNSSYCCYAVPISAKKMVADMLNH